MSTDFSTATADMLAAIGDLSTYRYVGGGYVSLYCLVDDSVEVVDESGQIIERVRAATIDKADLSDAPKMGDTLTVGARVYVVQRLLSDDGYAVQVSLS